MKSLIVLIAIASGLSLSAQTQQTNAVINPLSFGVVLDHPEMKNVKLTKDVTFFQDGNKKLAIDVYTPPALKKDEKRPAIIFLNAIGDRDEGPKIKSWGIYTSWPTLMAANGYIGISMETDREHIDQSIQNLFAFLDKNADSYQVDKNRLGVYAASANVGRSTTYLMSEKAYKGIKAAALYYGNAPDVQFRKDLPVLFIIAEGDLRNNPYTGIWSQVLKTNAPWTIKMGTNMPHAFDAYSDNDEARIIVKETISFWQNHLDPVPAPAWKYSKVRDALGSMQMNRDKGISLLKSIADENPNDVSAQLFYANALRQAQKTTEAKAVYQKVIKIDPKNMEALMALTAVAYSENDSAAAKSYLAHAEKTGKVSADHYGQLGFALIVANKNKESAYYYQKAIASEPRGHYYYNLACAYAKMNEKDLAITALKNTVTHGYGSKDQFNSDPDLDSIKTDQRYKAILDGMN